MNEKENNKDSSPTPAQIKEVIDLAVETSAKALLMAMKVCNLDRHITATVQDGDDYYQLIIYKK